MPDEILDESTPPTGEESHPPEAAAKPETPLTKADLEHFGNTLGEQIAKTLSAHRNAKPESEAPDWEAQFTDRVSRQAMQRMASAQAPMLAAQVTEQVAKGFDPEVRAEVAKTVAQLKPEQLAQLSDQDLIQLRRLARGIQAEREEQRTKAQAPRSSGSGTVNAAGAAENEMTAKFWNDYHDVPGFTKEMARDMAKEALAA